LAFIINASSLAKPSIDLARRLRGVAGYVVAGGHHATFTYPTLLRRGFDAVFLSEGEVSFGEFLKEVKEGGEWRRVRGIAYRDGDRVVTTGLPDFVEDLDKLPLPAFEIYDRESYRFGILDEAGSVVAVETSRGCPYNCEFCSVTKMWGARWRFKSVGRVLQELRRVLELGYRWVFFVDDNFIVPIRRVISERVELLRSIVREGLNKLRFIVQLRADFVAKNEWLPPLMYEAGVRVAFLGIESGDPEVLRSMRKNLVPEDSAKAVKLLSDSGIVVHGGFILGAPYEGEEAMGRTVRFALRLIDYGLDSAQFSIYTPLPGTDAFLRAAAGSSLLTLDWDLYNCITPVMRTRVPPARLFLKQRWANYYFFIRKGLRALLRGSLLSAPRSEKDIYIRNATRYILTRVCKYLADILVLPLQALTVHLRLRKGLSEEERRELEEVVEATRRVQEMWLTKTLRIPTTLPQTTNPS
jgi:anaerobic magnesium-protoporphyrin IX monomethyl ester cyclase